MMINSTVGHSPNSSWSAKADHPRVLLFSSAKEKKQNVDGRDKHDHDGGEKDKTGALAR